MAHPFLLAAGGMLIVVGLLLMRWAARRDLKSLVLDAAWQAARSRGRLDGETDLGKHFAELRKEGSTVARAKRIAGHAARHTLAQGLNVVGLLALAGGALLMGVAMILR